MNHIRPYKLFQQVEESPGDRVAKVMLPVRRAAGGTSLLETMLLISALRIVKADRVFEFGTFMGTNTFNLALNLPDNGEIFTLDLKDVSIIQHTADVTFAESHLSSVMDFQGTSQQSKIHRLIGNSRTFDFSPWHNSITLSFIDGGHDEETVKADTQSAFAMSLTEKPSCIVWHDYGNLDYPELTAYLDHLSRTKFMVHVEDTMLCFWFGGVASIGGIFPQPHDSPTVT